MVTRYRIETGGKLRAYGRRRFRDAGRTGRGEETRVATLPKISGRVLTAQSLAKCLAVVPAAADASAGPRVVFETIVPAATKLQTIASYQVSSP